MPVRFLEVCRDEDAATVTRLVGAELAPSSRGWAAVLVGEQHPGALCGPRGCAFVGALPELSRSSVAAVREGALRLSALPPPLRLGEQSFDWSRPVVMGIVNVTPDSFSDGGHFLAAAAAIEHGLQLVEEGADVLDIGGESTRPRGKTYGAGAQTVPVEEEIERVVPVIRGLRARTRVPISIDTRKSAVARAAVEAGATLVNDVTGLLHDRSIADVVRETGVALALMHTPADIEQLAHEQPSTDILGDVLNGLSAALARAEGIPRERILLDPGIGFGKTAAHNLYLLRQTRSLRALGCAVLVGASRKASIAKAAAGGGEVPPPAERVAASLGAAVSAYLHGAQMLRVHDVRATVQALRVAAAIEEAGDGLN